MHVVVNFAAISHTDVVKVVKVERKTSLSMKKPPAEHRLSLKGHLPLGVLEDRAITKAPRTPAQSTLYLNKS